MPKTTTAPAAERVRTSAEIEAEIAGLAATQAEAEAELGRLSAARPALLLDMTEAGDAKLERHDATAAKAARTVERAVAVQVKLRQDLASARYAEHQADLRGVYAKGEAAAAEYRRIVEKEYAPAAAKAAAALAAMGTHLAVVAAANDKLPEGARRIDPDAFRHPLHDPGTPPPAEIEVMEWRDPDGNFDRPVLTSRGAGQEPSAPAGYTQRKVMRPNPARATWRPAERRYAHDIRKEARLPAVSGGAPALWPEAAK